MQFQTVLFTSFTLQLAWIVAGGLLLVALFRAPWRQLLAVPLRQHALFAAIVVLGLIWSFRFEVVTGFHCHPFLMTTLTLVFGWCFALLCGALAGLLVALVGNADLQALPLDWLLTVAVPVSLAYGLMRLQYLLPMRNLFFYILGLGFFGTIVITLLTCMLVWLLLAATQTSAFMEIFWDRAAVVVPLLYAEGFLNGVLVTSITVFLPDLVKTFDDRHFMEDSNRR